MTYIESTDRDWEKWGSENPYFGVLNQPRFLNVNLNQDARSEFFASGNRHVEHVCEVIRANVKPTFNAVRVLDYGCGPGRLVVAFAKRSESVVGIDVSPSMVALARRNCAELGAPSARLLLVDEMNSLAPASFDLIHSYIVFQHIPSARGESMLRQLIELLGAGGVGAIHFTYSDSRPSLLVKGITELRQRVHLVNGLINLARHRPFSSPQMEMHNYSMNRLFNILIETHCSNVHIEFSSHGGYHGAMLYFEKSYKPLL